MKKLTVALSSNLPYIFGFIVFLFFASGFLFISNDRDAFLKLNSYHHPGLDTFFNFYSFLGNGVFSLIIAALFFMKRKLLLGMQVLSAYLISGIAVQIIKNLVYAPRPKLIFESSVYNHFIDGVTLSGTTAFPSGHAASAFALATILAFYTKNKSASLVYLLAAILAGYSRLYLGQHFLADIIMGALIGVITSFLILSYMTNPALILHFGKHRQRLKHKQNFNR